MSKIKHFKKLLGLSLCLIAMCIAFATGGRNAFSASALTENENSDTSQVYQYHGYDMDNFQAFFDYLNNLGYELNDIPNISLQDYLQAYWEAMDLGIIAPLENDFLLGLGDDGLGGDVIYNSEKTIFQQLIVLIARRIDE